MSIPIDKIKNLPQAPGVYFFYGSDKQLLYIGKATNLRSRVQSYFRGMVDEERAENLQLGTLDESADGNVQDIRKISEVAGRSEWIGLMVAQVSDIAFEQTDSVLEALILESNLIKKHQPKYNTLEKDDKSFSYFAITKEEFPRILIIRKTDFKKYVIPNLFRDIEEHSEMLKQVQHDKHDGIKKPKKLMPEKLQAVFGPYSSKMQMQTALKIIRRIFPFHAHKQTTEKGCLDFQLGSCPGPYAGAISKDDYKKNIRGIRMILEGKKKSLLRMLEKEMQVSAKKLEFEKAASLRNKIYALEHIRDVALMTRDFEEKSSVISHQSSENLKAMRIEAYDISNISGDHAVGSMVVFENGKPNKAEYRKFKIKTVEGSNDVAMMREILLRRFKNPWAMPDLVLLDGGQGHANMMGELILELGLDVLVVAVAKGKTRKNLNFQFPISNKISISQFPMELQNFLSDDNLVKSIMDEAHRFAITFHKHRRSKSFLK